MLSRRLLDIPRQILEMVDILLCCREVMGSADYSSISGRNLCQHLQGTVYFWNIELGLLEL